VPPGDEGATDGVGARDGAGVAAGPSEARPTGGSAAAGVRVADGVPVASGTLSGMPSAETNGTAPMPVRSAWSKTAFQASTARR
jgi:hypothetical protein